MRRCLSLTLPLTQLTEISIICLTKEENFLMQFHVIIHQMNLSVVYAIYLAEKKMENTYICQQHFFINIQKNNTTLVKIIKKNY